MATTTIGELLLHMEVDGDKQVLTALNRFIRTTERTKTANKNLRNTTSNLNSSFKDMDISMGSILKTFAGFKILDSVVDSFGYLIDKLKDGVKAGIDYNSNVEYLNASIKALLGSEEKAVQMTSDLVTLAAETPFSIEHYAKATKTLLGYGVASEDILPTIQMLGDVAMGNTSAFDRLALAYGQTTAKGKLQAEEVRQMVNQGFNPLKFIAEETGIEMTELSDKMRAGEITTEMVTKAFQRATEEGGRFDGMMEALSQTYKGQMEKIKEYGEIFWGKVTKPLYDILASAVFPIILENIKKLTAGVDILYGKIGETVPKIQDFINAFRLRDIEGIYNALKKLIPEDYQDNLVTATVVTLKVRDGLKWLKDEAFKVLEYLKKNGKLAFDFWESQVQAKVMPVIEDLVRVIKDMDFTEAKESLDRLKEAFILAEPYLKMFARFTIREVIDMAKGMWGLIKDMAEDIPTQLSLILDAGGILVDGFTILASTFKGDTDTMKKASKSLNEKVVSYFTKMRDLTNKSMIEMGVNLLTTVRNMNRDSNTWTGKMTANAIDKFLYLLGNTKTIWNNIKVAVAIQLNRMKSDASSRLNSIKNVLISAWNSAKSNTSNAWNSIKKGVTNAMNSAKKGVSNSVSSIKNIISNLKSRIKSILNFSLYQAGRNLIASLSSGIMSKIQSVKNAVSSVANSVKNFLGWSSPTKEGPGKESDKWIPNLMNMLIGGMLDHRRKLAKASFLASKSIASGLSTTEGSISSSIIGQTANSGIVNSGSSGKAYNIQIYADSFVRGKQIGKELIQELYNQSILTHKT